MTGDEDKIESLYTLLKPFGVREMMRTGRVAMNRGPLTSHGLENGRVKSKT